MDIKKETINNVKVLTITKPQPDLVEKVTEADIDLGMAMRATERTVLINRLAKLDADDAVDIELKKQFS